MWQDKAQINDKILLKCDVWPAFERDQAACETSHFDRNFSCVIILFCEYK